MAPQKRRQWLCDVGIALLLHHPRMSALTGHACMIAPCDSSGPRMACWACHPRAEASTRTLCPGPGGSQAGSCTG